MRAFDCPRCPLCSAQGVRRYLGLRDRLFSAPGEWNISQCPNETCGILWLDPMPAGEALGEAYKEYFTHGATDEYRLTKRRKAYLRAAFGYFAPPSGGIPLGERLLAAQTRLRFRRRSDFNGEVFHLAKPPAGARLLDVGCGSGAALKRMALLGWSVEGVEVDPQAVETARARGLTVHAGSLFEQKFPADTFDAVTLSHVIEHVHDPVALMAECRRILKPGGVLVMYTPNACSMGHAYYGSNWVALEPPRHLMIFTPAALHAATSKAGFSNIDVTTTIRGGEWIVLASQMIHRTGRGSETGRNLWLRRRWGRLFQAIEAFRLTIDKNVGEEIFVKARKDA